MSDKQGPVIPVQRIRIVSGKFENFKAKVCQVDTNTGKVCAEISVFGVVTPVELEQSECEPIA